MYIQSKKKQKDSSNFLLKQSKEINLDNERQN